MKSCGGGNLGEIWRKFEGGGFNLRQGEGGGFRGLPVQRGSFPEATSGRTSRHRDLDSSNQIQSTKKPRNFEPKWTNFRRNKNKKRRGGRTGGGGTQPSLPEDESGRLGVSEDEILLASSIDGDLKHRIRGLERIRAFFPEVAISLDRRDVPADAVAGLGHHEALDGAAVVRGEDLSCSETGDSRADDDRIEDVGIGGSAGARGALEGGGACDEGGAPG